MDLEKNIEIAAEIYQHRKCCVDKGIATECIDCFVAGAKSDAAREYWKAQFDRGGIYGSMSHCGMDAANELSEIVAREMGRSIIIVRGGNLSKSHLHGLDMEDRAISTIIGLMESEPIAIRAKPMEFTMRPEIQMTQYFEPKEVKPYDRKHMEKRQFKKRR